MTRMELRTRRLSKDNAYFDLKEKIIFGELKPDEVVPEEKLANLLSISRTPLREAIQRLENEEFLVRQPNGRLKVASVSKKEVEEIFLIRSMLEGFIARNATKNATERDIQTLTTSLENMRESHELGNNENIVTYGNDFHDCLSEMSGLHTFPKILNMIKDHAIRYCILVSMYGDWNEKADKEHTRILNCIIEKDEEGAEMAMKDHILSSLETAVNRIPEMQKE
ncbi:GntR family transcriptional regulator [Halalkalibacter lacteus]|uniref:GntR family transcriptional regulator n=1 Tax=Halalkalibacter lacteus TaxID=3090663 RepID=UPI002FCC0228